MAAPDGEQCKIRGFLPAKGGWDSTPFGVDKVYWDDILELKKGLIIMKIKLKTLWDFVKVYGSGIVAAVVVLVVAYQFVAPAPPKELSIATASKSGAYYAYALQYQKLFEKENIKLNVIETSGSAENLELLAKGAVEVAFVQSGVGSEEQYPDLSGLASLYMEPLLIFMRKGESVDSMISVQGLRLAIGAEGSGTRSIMLNLLKDNNLDYAALATLPLGGDEAIDALLHHEADIAFMVSKPDSPAVLKILANQQISLITLSRAEVYARRHAYLSHLVLPRGVFDLSRDLPPADIDAVAPAATLVAGTNLHPALSDLLLQIAAKVHSGGILLDRDIRFPSKLFLDFPVSQEAERFFKYGPPFLQRYLPFWAASLVDRLKVMLLPLLALIVPLMKILPPTYRWRVRSRIYRWYDELHELDQRAGDDNASLPFLQQCSDQLGSMEAEVRQLEVPLSYAEELYHLRLHIDLLRTQLERRINQKV